MKGLFYLLLLGACVVARAQDIPQPPQSQIFYALDNTSVGPSRTVNAGVVQSMMDSIICRMTGQTTPALAWRKYFSPKDRIGIKVAAAGRAVSGTNPELVDAIARGLIAAGIPPRNIIVWDRNMDDLLAAGYDKNGDHYVLKSIDPKTGYDPQAVVTAPVLGKLIWGDSQFGRRNGGRPTSRKESLSEILDSDDGLSSNSFFSKILTSDVTKVINVPSLTDSYMTGVNGGIVNMTLTNIDNWRRFAKSAAEGDSYIADVYTDPTIQGKVVLTILDGLILQYAGGPFPNPNFAINNYGIFASQDVVAIDATAVRLIDEQRKLNRLPSVMPQTAWIQAAADAGLGNFAVPRIAMIRVGVGGFR